MSITRSVRSIADRLKPAHAVAVGVVEEHQQLQQQRDHHGGAAHEHALGHPPLCGVCEEQQVGEDDRGDQEECQPQRDGDDALGTVDPGDARLFAVGGLAHPPVVGGLLDGRLRVDGRDRQEHLGTPGVDLVPQLTGSELVPLRADHVSRVADELAGELRICVRQELGRLDLLGHDRGFGLGARARLVVRREPQEDDEAEEDGETGGQDSEDTRGSITVREVAALRCPSPHDQHGRHRDRGDDDGDDEPDDDVHAAAPAWLWGPSLCHRGLGSHHPLRMRPGGGLPAPGTRRCPASRVGPRRRARSARATSRAARGSGGRCW